MSTTSRQIAFVAFVALSLTWGLRLALGLAGFDILLAIQLLLGAATAQAAWAVATGPADDPWARAANLGLSLVLFASMVLGSLWVVALRAD